jgi:hypothetical protein
MILLKIKKKCYNFGNGLTSSEHFPSCTNGTDKICGDGYCYLSTDSCPTEYDKVLNSTGCSCGSYCSNSSSSLQVKKYE